MDNLRFLLSLDDNCIDLIAIDPPFGKMLTFTSKPKPPITHAEKGEEIDLFLRHYPGKTEDDFPEPGEDTEVEDIWEWIRNVEREASHARFMRELRAEARAYDAQVDEAVEGDVPAPPLAVKLYRVIEASMVSVHEDMAAYIAFMAQRLVECHRVLKPTGSIYIHCDWKANSYLRALMDTIFGEGNMRNEIAWKKYVGRKNNAKLRFNTQHDTILFYAKSEKSTFHGVFIPHSEEEIAKKYNNVDEHGRKYRLSWGRAYQLRGEQKRIYLDESPGRAVSSLWIEDGLQLNTSSRERTGYATQKPIALLQRIIRASSNPGDTVLDVFAGCATTAVAAEIEGRNWLACDKAYRATTMIKRSFYQNARALAKKGESPYVLSWTTRTTSSAYGEEWNDEWERLSSQIIGPNDVSPREQQLPDLETARAEDRVRRPNVWSGSIPRQECKNLLIEWHGCCCWGCAKEPKLPDGRDDRDELEVDHIDPKSAGDGSEWGGDDELDNLALLCRRCNGRKSNKLTLDQLRADREAAGRVWKGGPLWQGHGGFVPYPSARGRARVYLKDRARQIGLSQA